MCSQGEEMQQTGRLPRTSVDGVDGELDVLAEGDAVRLGASQQVALRGVGGVAVAHLGEQVHHGLRLGAGHGLRAGSAE